MLGDFTRYSEGPFGNPGSTKYEVTSGTTSSVNSGEPVAKALGQEFVATAATNTPVVATNFFAGISTSTSTETASAAGEVMVENSFAEDVSYLCAPTVAGTWDTQAKYNALVGARVLLDKTSGVYTVLATDGANNGVVVLPLDISLHPGKVRIAFRKAVNYLA
jgi:hypothetical protein